jgi:hypothetical protein
MPAWETVFISVGFAGMAVGLAIALPIYMRERWPDAFVGRLGDGPHAPAPARTPRDPYMVRAALAVSSVLGLLWLYWAIGGTLGLDLAHREMDLNGRLLSGNSGIWAFIGVWSIWVVTTRRYAARLPLWVPMSLAFIASGSLFAWSGWKLFMAVLRPGGYVPPEHPVVTVVQYALAIGAGIAILAGARAGLPRSRRRPARAGVRHGTVAWPSGLTTASVNSLATSPGGLSSAVWTTSRPGLAMLPRIDLPQLLLEVHAWTRFLDAYTHLADISTQMDDLPVSLAALLVREACNIGLTR